jgi:hypothetical protein
VQSDAVLCILLYNSDTIMLNRAFFSTHRHYVHTKKSDEKGLLKMNIKGFFQRKLFIHVYTKYMNKSGQAYLLLKLLSI